MTRKGVGVKQYAGVVTRHGTGVKQDADDRDTEQFFRAVDEAVLKDLVATFGAAPDTRALPEHHHLFRTVSRNPNLMGGAIDVHPDCLSLDALRERVWQFVQPHYLDWLSGLVELFGAACSNRRGADDLGEIAAAAIAGRVETLLIEADRLVRGCIDAAGGAIMTGDLCGPHIDDVLDDLSETVLKKVCEVIIVPAERMSTRSGPAAIYGFR